MTGACQDTVTPILAGQIDYDTLATTTLNIPAVTTETFLNSQTYEIVATTATSIPEPVNAGLMLSGLAVALLISRRHSA